jgi:hypothetical protein
VVLGRRELGSLLREQEELLGHVEASAEEVDVLEGQAEGLTLSEPGPGAKNGESPVAVRHGLDECQYVLGAQRDDRAPLALREADTDTRGLQEQLVGDRGAEDRRQVAVEDHDGGCGEFFGSALDPGLDLTRPDRPEGAITEVGVDVSAEVRLYLRLR